MPTLEDDTLVFRFPEIDKDASFSIDFQRTLRIPDTDKTYSLPPGLGSFPLRHAEDFASNLPSKTGERGGVILPMWQAEAMWLHFRNDGPEYDLDFPVAIKIAAGKINAVTGEAWRPGLHRAPQDYMVSPDQPWLDGFAIEKGVIRQFVAMPLGAGYSVEEQLTNESEWGGIQISVTPLKAHVWKAKRAAWEKTEIITFERRKNMLFAVGVLHGNGPSSRWPHAAGNLPRHLQSQRLGPSKRTACIRNSRSRQGLEKNHRRRCAK